MTPKRLVMIGLLFLLAGGADAAKYLPKLPDEAIIYTP